jgi:uncharacterized protein YceH (UPF0502 family)
VLLLRGWQTPGELRTRTQRLHDFNDVLDVEKALHHMMGRNPALICKLAREPGKRESRYAHLFAGEITEQEQTTAGEFTHDAEDGLDELTTLKQEMAILRAEYQQLSERVTLLEGLI